jgi:hypothetical protein
MPGKRIQFDDETLMALDVLARDRTMTFQELADEAFDDLLKKHHRPTDLKSALKQSAETSGDVSALGFGEDTEQRAFHSLSVAVARPGYRGQLWRYRVGRLLELAVAARVHLGL